MSVFCLLCDSGSSVENWHAILRKGLTNALGTNMQLNGAVYGPGIYLSPDSSISFSHATKHQTSSKMAIPVRQRGPVSIALVSHLPIVMVLTMLV